jgi:hypothetical protein
MQGNTLYSLPAALMLIVRKITTRKSKNESRREKSCAHQNWSPIPKSAPCYANLFNAIQMLWFSRPLRVREGDGNEGRR